MRTAVQKLREAAEALQRTSGEVLMPGWDEEEGESPQAIRSAARAIAGDDVDPDEGVKVSARDLAALVRYIADMLEE